MLFDAEFLFFLVVCDGIAKLGRGCSPLRMRLDPVANPYTPGAGQRPTVLSGRDQELSDFRGRLQRLEKGRAAQCTLIVGLRGVGKTVLLESLSTEAAGMGWVVVDHELRTGGDLVGTIARLARQALLEIAPPSAWSAASQRVASVLRRMEVSYQIVGLGVSFGAGAEGDEGAAASGDPARDLTDLLLSLGSAAQEGGRGVAFMLDELQYADVEPLGALLAALHKVAQRSLPLTVVAAGLPQTRGVLAEAATYSERMFDTRDVGALGVADARRALTEPAAIEGVSYTDGALEVVVTFTECYPFFLQVFGDHLWKLATSSTIAMDDARRAQPLVRDWLDRGFFTFRTDRLPATQRRYLRAMAELGPQEQSSGAIAAVLGLASSAPVGQIRDALIRRGLIYSPRTGYAAFSVPQFDDYLRRHFDLEKHQPRRRRST